MASTRNELSLNTVLAIAGAAGLIVLLILMAIADFDFWPSLLWGVIVAIIVALILIYQAKGRAAPDTARGGSAGSGSSATGASTAPAAPAAPKPEVAPAPAPAASETPTPPAEPEPPAGAPAAPAAASTTPEPAVKPSKPLPGEAELAAREGSWKYQGDAEASAEPAPAAPAATEPAPAASGGATEEGTRPELLTAAREGGADDLKMIKGVGPKMEKMLNEMGVFHFDQVAEWSASEVAWVDRNLKGFKGRVSRDGWVEQAATLAAGGSTEFASRVKKGDVY